MRVVKSSVDDNDTGVVVFRGERRLVNVVGDIALPAEVKLSSGDDQ